jgi:hypothetical protein
MQNLTTWSKSVETDKSCLTTLHNEYARDFNTLLKKTSPLQTCIEWGLCQKQITQIIKRTFGPCGKYRSRPSNGTTLDRYIHRRQLTRGILRSNRTSTARIRICQFHEQTLPSLDLQYRSRTRRRIYHARISLHLSLHSSMCRT